MADKIQIEIPKVENENEVANILPGKDGFNSYIQNKLDKLDQVLYTIIIAVVLSSIAIIVSVIGLFLDQMRYNNAAYREYSEKIQILDSTEKTNRDLSQQDKQNQELILKQQGQINNLLKQAQGKK